MEVTTCHGIELKQEKVQSLVFSLDLKNVSYCFFSKEKKNASISRSKNIAISWLLLI